jgi:hypothetical protein
MTRILLTAAVAISLIVPITAADAAGAKKRRSYEYDHHYGISRTLQAPVGLRTPRPAWAGPNECYTDEGYGRFAPCSWGRH